MSGSDNIKLALKITADAKQAIAETKATQEQLRGVEAAARGAGNGTDAYTQQLNKLGSVQRNAAQQAKNTADALALMAKIDPTAGKLDKLDQLEASLNRLHKAGAVGEDDFKALGVILGAQRAKLSGVASDMDKVGRSTLNARTQYSLFALISDAATGQFSRSRREVAALANETGILGSLLNPVGIAIGAVAAVLGVLAIAFVREEEETLAFNRAIIGTGQAGTTTGAQLVDMANRIGAATGRYGDAEAALTQLAASGKYTSNQYEQLTQVAVDFATMTGGKLADGVKFVDGVMSGNIQTLMRWDDQVHFLSASQLAEIERLQDLGEQQQATTIAMRAAVQATHDGAQEVKKSAGIMVHAWDGVKSAASAAWAAMKDVGATHSISEQLKDALAELQRISQPQYVGAGNFIPVNQAAVAALKAQIKNLRSQLVAQGFAQTQAAVNQNAETKSKQGLAYLDQFKPALQAFQDAKAKAKAAFDKTMLGNLTADEIARAKAEYKQALEAAQLAYNSALKKEHPGASALNNAQNSAAIAAAQSAVKHVDDVYANGQKLIEAQHRAALVNDQAYFDAERGMLAEWESDKVAALEREKQAATSHIVTQADRVKADQKVGEIDSEIAKIQADAAARRTELDAQEQQATERATQAWETLRRSMETPVNAKIDAAIDKIRKLNKTLALGAGDASQYHELLKEVGENSLIKLPHYSGLDAAVGGVGSELEKNFRAELALEAAYREEKKALAQKFDDQDEAQAEAHQAALDKLDSEHAKERANIGRARGQLELDTAANLFGQLAVLSTSHNKKMAAIGKAAAIAQTVIKTYQSATEAYASLAGIPYIGPELGAAAAAIAIAAGLANVAAIRSQPTGGYSEGGPTPPGPKLKVAGLVHAGEDVWSQEDIRRAGGIANVERMRLRGYADGGFVSPFANAPSPAQLGFSAPSASRVRMSDFAANDDAHARQAPPPVHVFAVFDPAELADKVMNSGPGHKVIVNVAGNNPRAIQAKWSR